MSHYKNHIAVHRPLLPQGPLSPTCASMCGYVSCMPANACFRVGVDRHLKRAASASNVWRRCCCITVLRVTCLKAVSRLVPVVTSWQQQKKMTYANYHCAVLLPHVAQYRSSIGTHFSCTSHHSWAGNVGCGLVMLIYPGNGLGMLKNHMT